MAAADVDDDDDDEDDRDETEMGSTVSGSSDDSHSLDDVQLQRVAEFEDARGRGYGEVMERETGRRVDLGKLAKRRARAARARAARAAAAASASGNFISDSNAKEKLQSRGEDEEAKSSGSSPGPQLLGGLGLDESSEDESKKFR